MNESSGPNAKIADLITKLGQQTNNLRRMCTKIGTHGDTKDFRATLEKNRNEAKQLSHVILERLRTNKGGDKQLFEKLKNQFQQALTGYQEVSKAIENKLQGAVDRSSKGDEGTTARGGNNRPKRGMPRRSNDADPELGEGGRFGRNGSSSAAAAAEDGKDSLLQSDQQQEFDFTPYDEQDLAQRRRDIAALEQDVQDVAEMFRDLATMVNEQQEGIDTIAGNIEHAKQHAEEGEQQLVTAEDYQKKARRKKCCLVFLVLIVLALVILGIVVLRH